MFQRNRSIVEIASRFHSVMGLVVRLSTVARLSTLTKGVVTTVLLCFASTSWADEVSLSESDINAIQIYVAQSLTHESLADVDVTKSYALGINRFDLDHQTEIMGWKVANRWYLGRQDGLDSGLTLVWHQATNQVSFSKDGVRLTRRF